MAVKMEIQLGGLRVQTMTGAAGGDDEECIAQVFVYMQVL